MDNARLLDRRPPDNDSNKTNKEKTQPEFQTGSITITPRRGLNKGTDHHIDQAGTARRYGEDDSLADNREVFPALNVSAGISTSTYIPNHANTVLRPRGPVGSIKTYCPRFRTPTPIWPKSQAYQLRLHGRPNLRLLDIMAATSTFESGSMPPLPGGREYHHSITASQRHSINTH